MSRKISEYFKFQPKSDSNLTKNLKLKVENEEYFEIELNKVKIEPNTQDLLHIKDEIEDQPPKLIDMDLHNKKGYESCKFCDKKLSTSKLTEHMKNVHPTEFNLLSCEFCNLKFFKKNFLKAHIKTKHPNGQNHQFECDFDGRIFKSKMYLNTHMLRHQSPVQCKICNKMFSAIYIKDHLRTFHSIDKNFSCKICSKSFKTALYLFMHEKTHNKKFQCDICSRKFSTKTQLNKHKMDIHENPKRFECDKCDKKYNQNKSLISHQKTHDKKHQKQFKCHRCGLTTNNKNTFKIHQQSHDRKDKKIAAMKNPLKCEKCPAFCKNMQSLLSHMRVVHPKVLFQCDLCAKFIKQKYSLISHLKFHISKASKE